jgi:hypothetical protein
MDLQEKFGPTLEGILQDLRLSYITKDEVVARLRELASEIESSEDDAS